MRNVNIVVKPDETQSDIISQICQDENIRLDDYFAFSAIMTEDVDGQKKLKINCIEPQQENPYTPRSLIEKLFENDERTSVKYVVPPLELYLTVYRPMLHKMVSKAYPYYQRLIPDRDELMSILFLSIVKLYDQGYYLHNHLIYKSFVNELNMEVRKLKHFTNIASLDAEIGTDEDGQALTLMDQLEDPISTDEARHQFHYTENDYWEDMFNLVKSTMLDDMSQLAFDRILIQLKTKTIDRSTSGKLTKYRKIFNDKYNPRNNAGDNHYRRRPKGGEQC